MPAPEDDRAFSVQEIRVAVTNGHLPSLAERLARQRCWFALASLFERTTGLTVPLPMLEETVRECAVALRRTPERRRDSAARSEDMRAVRLLAGEALARRVPRPTHTESDRRALRTAGSMLADGGDFFRAATLLEDAADWPAAAEVWGRLGELERMEACLARDDEESQSRRAARGAVRDVEILLAAGERLAALRMAEAIPEGMPDAAAAQQIARAVAARLVRARAVTLRLASDRAQRAARVAATPAVIGRDPLAEIPLRDPSVSRRHALVTVVGDEVSLSDAGSRAGTFVAGARLTAALPVRGPVEVTLGSCRLELALASSGHVRITAKAGLDGHLLALAGSGPLPIAGLFPHVEGVWIEFSEGCARFGRPAELPVRIAGRLVATRVDLLHGDVLEIGASGARLEVE